MSLKDKSSVVDELLSLCGWKINKLMGVMEGNQMTSLAAHLSPSILQWIKKQVISYLPVAVNIYCIASNYGWSHINTRSHLVARV